MASEPVAPSESFSVFISEFERLIAEVMEEWKVPSIAQRYEIAASHLLSIVKLKSARSRRRRSRCKLARIAQTCPGRNRGLGPMIFALFHAGRRVAVSEHDGSLSSMVGLLCLERSWHLSK
jgi:hypothetical protein